MKEVVYPTPEYLQSNTDKQCPSCNGSMRFGSIPCPEGRAGCAVMHYGYTCLQCGKVYQG